MERETEKPKMMSEDQIVAAIEAAQSDVIEKERQREALEQSLRNAREELRLLEQLLAVRRGTTAPGADRIDPGGQLSRVTVEHQARQPAVAVVIEELARAGRPLHISELMRLLRERQVSVPGAGTQANLITHLRRDDRLVRPTRGMYALAAWGLENMAASQVMRRRKRKRVVTTARPTSGKE